VWQAIVVQNMHTLSISRALSFLVPDHATFGHFRHRHAAVSAAQAVQGLFVRTIASADVRFAYGRVLWAFNALTRRLTSLCAVTKRDNRVAVSFEATFAGEKLSVRTDLGAGSVLSASCRLLASCAHVAWPVNITIMLRACAWLIILASCFFGTEATRLQQFSE